MLRRLTQLTPANEPKPHGRQQMALAETSQQTEMIFNRADQARKVCRRLRDYSVLSRVVGRELRIEVPVKMTSQSVWELAQRIHRGEA